MSKMIVNIAIFGAFSLMVLVFGFFLWQTLFAPEKTSYTNSKPEITDGDHPGQENSLGGRAIPRGSNSTEEAIAEYTKWLAIFTLFLVLATVGLFISGERNVDVARKSANAARDSAIATQNAVELSDKTAERQLRAYVGILDHTLSKVSEGEKPEIALIITNYGHTPARDVQFWVLTKCEPYLPNIKLPRANFRPGKLALFPTDKDTFIIQSGDPLGAGDMAGLQSGDRRLYVYGGIQYMDVFGRTRTTEFRLMYGGTDALRVGRLAWAEEGNEAD